MRPGKALRLATVHVIGGEFVHRRISEGTWFDYSLRGNISCHVRRLLSWWTGHNGESDRSNHGEMARGETVSWGMWGWEQTYGLAGLGDRRWSRERLCRAMRLDIWGMYLTENCTYLRNSTTCEQVWAYLACIPDRTCRCHPPTNAA